MNASTHVVGGTTEIRAREPIINVGSYAFPYPEPTAMDNVLVTELR